MDTIKLEFEGYWREINKSGVPAKSGIYCVYRATYNQSAGTVSLKELIYIGESENAKDRIQGHEKEREWKKHLKYGEILCFSFAPISDRFRAEAALIYKHKPVVNTEYVSSFPFRSVNIKLSGETALLNSDFTVRDTRSLYASY